jgi:hypothetical protein
MALAFKCQNCGRTMTVESLKVGEIARCRKCGTDNTVPHSCREVSLKPDQVADDDIALSAAPSTTGSIAGGIKPANAGNDGIHAQPVVITDIHMSFGSMVEFMVKWAFASIPAVIIIGLVVVLFMTIVSGLTCGGLSLLR